MTVISNIAVVCLQLLTTLAGCLTLTLGHRWCMKGTVPPSHPSPPPPPKKNTFKSYHTPKIYDLLPYVCFVLYIGLAREPVSLK